MYNINKSKVKTNFKNQERAKKKTIKNDHTRLLYFLRRIPGRRTATMHRLSRA